MTTTQQTPKYSIEFLFSPAKGYIRSYIDNFMESGTYMDPNLAGLLSHTQIYLSIRGDILVKRTEYKDKTFAITFSLGRMTTPIINYENLYTFDYSFDFEQLKIDKHRSEIRAKLISHLKAIYPTPNLLLRAITERAIEHIERLRMEKQKEADNLATLQTFLEKH